MRDGESSAPAECSAAPVVRVGLKRVTLDEWVLADGELLGAPCFRLLGEEALRALLSSGRGRRFGHGARIFLCGDRGDSMFLVLKGEARLTVGTGGATVEVAVARKGEVIGEGEALGEGPLRTSTATALTDVEVVELPRLNVELWVRRRPAFGAHLRAVSAERRTVGAELADFLDRW